MVIQWKGSFFLKKIVIGFFILCLLILGVLNLPAAPSSAKQTFGITFSKSQAQSLGLDWKKTYLELLDSLGVRNLRLSAYWNSIEPAPGAYDFADLDFQIGEAEKRGAKVLLAVGRKLPRWPECHDPVWLSVLSDTQRESALLTYLKEVVMRYKDHPTVAKWQVENEIFFPFGVCPRPFGAEILRKEVALVRSLSLKQIVVTDSGEWTPWIHVAVFGDILGSSLYREAWNDMLGRIPFPIQPGYYQFKAAFLSFFDKKVIITELQAEPWGKKGLSEMTLSEMQSLFPVSRLKEHLDFAKRTGFSDIGLWGAEWWYWMKLHGDPSYWNEMKKYIHSSI